MNYLVAIVFGLSILIPFGLIIWLIVYASDLATRLVGKCRSCNYDLRASKQAGDCPECGHSFEINDRGEPIS
jgi:hypothetical protein